MKQRQEESFGIIPLSKKEGQWHVFLIQHRAGRYWGFPKGHAEPNETPLQAALRELKEETSLECITLMRETPLEEQYYFQVEGKRIFKRVAYFVAEVSGEVVLQKEEINDGIWVPFPEAIDKVTHLEGKSILTEVRKMLLKIGNR
jgi:8-oxo-dGTP pyrophosphatase MutT (NUDIX family)